jgi:signal transduction histidine kinase
VVEASLSNGRLLVQVRHNGPGFTDPAAQKPGHGLDLLRRRLESLFGDAASLEWRTQDGLTVVSLSVPA